MHRLILAVSALGLIMLAAAGPASAGGLTEAGELHAARLNALAGGPTNARDAELLDITPNELLPYAVSAPPKRK